MEEREIREDQRYKQAGREALIGTGLFLLNFIWWFLFAYGLGSGPVEEYDYIIGFPAWFFYSCVLGYPVFVVLTILMVKMLFKPMSLDSESRQGER